MDKKALFFFPRNSSNSGGTSSSVSSDTARKLSANGITYTPQKLKDNFKDLDDKINNNQIDINTIKDDKRLQNKVIDNLLYDSGENKKSHEEMKEQLNNFDKQLQQIDNNDSKSNQLIQILSSNQGKIKVSQDDVLDYIENKLDNITIENKDNKLVVKNILGLKSTIEELNNLQGLNQNIMTLIKNIVSGMEFLGIKDHYSDLKSISPKNGNMVIIKQDETKDNQEIMYIFDGKEWIDYGKLDVQIRDFIKQPINLSNEVIGKLSINNIDKTQLDDEYASKNEIKLEQQKVDQLNSSLNLIDTKTIENKNNITDLNKKLDDKLDKPKTQGYIKINSDGNIITNKEINSIDIAFDSKEVFQGNLKDKQISNLHDILAIIDRLKCEGNISSDIDVNKLLTKQGLNEKLGSNQLKTDSKDIIQAINEVFTKSYRGKGLVANAIGDMSLATKTYEEISNNIIEDKTKIVEALKDKGIITEVNIPLENYAKQINSIVQDSKLKNTKLKNTKLNMKKGETKIIELTNPIDIEHCCTSVLEYKAGQGNIVCYNCDFDNGDNSNFNFDDSIEFNNGTMEQKNKVFETEMLPETEDEKYKYSSAKFNIDDFYNISNIDVVDKEDTEQFLQIEGTYNPALVTGNGDINLLGIEKVNKIEWVGSVEGNNKMKFIFSMDSGITWKTLNLETNRLNTIDIKDSNNLNKAMNVDVLNKLDEKQLNTIFQNTSKIRFGYYFEKYDANNKLNNDKITIYVDMKGKSVPSKNVEWNLSEDGKNIIYNVLNNGTYTILWVDKES